MSEKHWDPLADLLGLQERMNRLFDLSLERLDPPGQDDAAWAPTADIYETDDFFVVHVELAGVPEDGVKVQISARQVTVRGDRGLPGPERPDAFYRMERRYGTFLRRMRLPGPVDADSMRARFRDGVLRIEIRKAARGNA